MLENVVVIGHSFVRELREKGEDDPAYYNLGLDQDITPVYYVDRINGDNVVFAAQIYDWMRLYPDYVKNTNLVLLDLSTNDLKSWYKDDGQSLACHLFTAALRLRDAGVNRVGIYECLYRDGLACVPAHMRNHATPAQIQAATTKCG